MNIKNIVEYERAVAVVKDLPTLFADNDKIWGYFQYQTHTSYTEVTRLLQPNSNPEILPVWNLKPKGQHAWGNTPRNGTTIEIRKNLLFGLHTARLKTTIYNTAFLMAVTLLHELVHYCRNYKTITEQQAAEAGSNFEIWAFNGIVNDTNALYLNKYQKSFHNLKWITRNDKNIINDTDKY